jgi:hypothetical protein
METKTKMTVEELLKPRVKIIAPWPICSKHTKPEDVPKVGQIFYLEADGSISNDSIVVKRVYDYPHLFKKLNWWEDRSPEEMPEYVKVYRGHGKEPYWHHIHVDGVDTKWTFFQGKPLCVTYKSGGVNSIEMLEPSTETDYLNAQK